MEGGYIDDMVRALEEAGISPARAGNAERWSTQIGFDLFGLREAVEQGGDLINMMTRQRDEEDLSTQIDPGFYGRSGRQFNLIGYSYGGVIASQVALKYSRHHGGKTDNLVLLGTPIGPRLLKQVNEDVNIRKVHIINLDEHGDPIKPGMLDSELAGLTSVLREQLDAGEGHFHYSVQGDLGASRRRELARDLFERGMR